MRIPSHLVPLVHLTILLPPTACRMRYSSLLLLEDILVRHPKLRIWAMHAGWPLADDTIATLYAHPQLYVGVGVICFAFSRKQFYDFVQRLVDAGFEKRIMFGSDEIVWPGALSAGIDSIEPAPSLTLAQKRDTLYNNAARFLRMEKRRWLIHAHGTDGPVFHVPFLRRGHR